MQIPPYGLKQRRRPQFWLPHRATTPNSESPPSLAGSCRLHTVSGRIHPGSNAPLWLHASQSSPKWEKLILYSSQSSVQNFMPSFSAAQKSVTIHTKKKHTVTKYLPILPYGGIITLDNSRWLGSLVVRALHSQLNGHKFDFWLPQCQVTTVGKLYTPLSLQVTMV